MSCVDSSVVSSSALLVLASSVIRLLFFSISSRRYFSSSFFGIFATRAVLVAISRALLFRPPVRTQSGARFGTRDDTRLFRPGTGLQDRLRRPLPGLRGGRAGARVPRATCGRRRAVSRRASDCL